MPEPPNDPLLGSFVVGVWLLSIATGIYLISLTRRGPILTYEPRRPVPWGPVATALSLLFVLLAFSSRQGDEVLQAGEFSASALLQVFIVGAFFVVVVVASGATTRDLGLPKSASELASDIFIGIVAGVAAIAPVDTILAVLKIMFSGPQEMSQHALIKMVTEGEPNVTVLAAASLIAVVVAPICEEFTFRLLLQGWLEKWEDSRVTRRTNEEMSNDAARETQDEEMLPNDELRITNDEAAASEHSSFPNDPPSRGFAGLPHGWAPIFVSSLLFAAAHFGYGPEPIPLFFLALILGYVYQRTHRIVPCIVIHALFNGFSMLLLWRLVFHAAK